MRGKIDDPQAWLNFARRNLARARQEISSEDQAYAVFFLQQAAEKCLKGKLVALGWDLVKTHDLIALSEEDARSFLADVEKLFAQLFPDEPRPSA